MTASDAKGFMIAKHKLFCVHTITVNTRVEFALKFALYTCELHAIYCDTNTD